MCKKNNSLNVKDNKIKSHDLKWIKSQKDNKSQWVTTRQISDLKQYKHFQMYKNDYDT